MNGPLPDAVLVNCIYLKADWEKPFTQSNTSKEPFSVPNRPPINVAMMKESGSYRYLRGDGFEAIALPYANAPLWAVAVLPSPYSNAGTLPNFSTIFAALSSEPPQYGKISMPKFRSEFECDLVKSLTTAGMAAAFSREHQMQHRDFAPLLADKGAMGQGFYIKKCIHKVFIDVDEKGTEAAAVTAAHFTNFGMPVPPPQPQFDFRCDRPFRFYICTSAACTPNQGRVVFQGDIFSPTVYVDPPCGYPKPVSSWGWQRQQPQQQFVGFGIPFAPAAWAEAERGGGRGFPPGNDGTAFRFGH
jgi:serpin B